MIYTVTLTPALDKTVVIPDFTVDHVNRIRTVRLDPGGKGINVSKVLKALGMESVATGILGGGTGRFILDRLDEMRIAHDFVTVPEETRTNLKVIDDVRNTHTDINEPGAPADPAVLDRVLSGLLSSVQPGDRVVLAGKAPAGAPDTLFGEWILALKARGALPYLDADASLLVHGAAAGPEMIKPNDEELGRLTGRSFESIEEIASAARDLGEGGVHTVAVSLGADGALFYRDGALLRGAGLHPAARQAEGPPRPLGEGLDDALQPHFPGDDQFRIEHREGRFQAHDAHRAARQPAGFLLGGVRGVVGGDGVDGAVAQALDQGLAVLGAAQRGIHLEAAVLLQVVAPRSPHRKCGRRGSGSRFAPQAAGRGRSGPTRFRSRCPGGRVWRHSARRGCSRREAARCLRSGRRG